MRTEWIIIVAELAACCRYKGGSDQTKHSTEREGEGGRVKENVERERKADSLAVQGG